MQFEFEYLPCNVWGKFKHGDNACYNAEILNALVKNNDNGRFNKLIVIQAASLIEVATYQIFWRAAHHTVEGVPHVSEKDQTEIVNKELEKFAIIIDNLKKYKILDGLWVGIYDELHDLRKLRNKIHIQVAELDEKEQFTTDITKWAIELNWYVIKYLDENYKRPSHLHCYVEGLTLPRLKKL